MYVELLIMKNMFLVIKKSLMFKDIQILKNASTEETAKKRYSNLILEE